jgi:hypothetical protein
MDLKRFTKDLTKTNFKLGEDQPDFKSVSQNTYVPHNYRPDKENKELSMDLRSIYFNNFRTSFPIR